MNQSPKRILVIRLSSLGDIVLTQPICALLQQAYPDAEITMLCKEQYAELPKLFSPPVKVLVYRKSISFHQELLLQHFDLIIDLHVKLASWIVRQLVKSAHTVHYDKQRSTRRRIVAGNKTLAIDSTVSLYASALGKLGISDNWNPPVLQNPQIPDSVTDNAKAIKTIAIIPGATYYTKRYPTPQWIELINTNNQHRYRLYGSSSDAGICNSIVQNTKADCIDLCTKLSITGLHTSLAGCDLIISGDTGPMHLAATLNKPQIAIFGGTHPRLGFRPLNDKAIILCTDLPCQPCSLHGRESCPLGHFKCMRLITVDTLHQAVHKLLSENDSLKVKQRA